MATPSSQLLQRQWTWREQINWSLTKDKRKDIMLNSCSRKVPKKNKIITGTVESNSRGQGKISAMLQMKKKIRAHTKDNSTRKIIWTGSSRIGLAWYLKSSPIQNRIKGSAQARITTGRVGTKPIHTFKKDDHDSTCIIQVKKVSSKIHLCAFFNHHHP